MPPHTRNSNRLLINKQKKLIASRLMQISLKVDDYVYKNVAISAKTALMFIEEVSGYKDKCYEDKRCLQVIEKLIRCMKGIIAEQQELQGRSTESDGYTVVDVETILASSVDDDMAQLTQKIDVVKIFESTKNDIETVDLGDNSTDCREHFKTNEIVDLSNDDRDKNKKAESKNKNKQNRSINENLQRSISYLTIGHENYPLSITPFDSEDCSQSILNDIGCTNFIEIGKAQNTDRIEYGQDLNVQPEIINKEYKNKREVTNVASDSIIKNCKVKYPRISKIANNTDPLKNSASNAKKNNCDTHKNLTKQKEQPKRRQKRSQNFDKDNEHQILQKSTKKNKQKRKSVEPNVTSNKALEKIQETIENSSKNEIVNNLNMPVKNKRWNDNSYLPANAEVRYSSKNTFNEKPANTVYNSYVENDLSWIENIRYVREIALEEKIPANFEDSFWENYTLPNDWNNDDFLYN